MESGKLREGRKIVQVQDGARQVFLRDGYAGASVDDIAHAARVSKATLYSYFPEKSAMYREVMIRELSEMEKSPVIAIADHSTASDALPVITRQIADWQLSPKVSRLQRVMIAEATRFPEIARNYQQMIDRILHDVIRTHLDRWTDRHELRIEDTDLAARQLVRLAGAELHEAALLEHPGEQALESRIAQISDSAARVFLASHQPDANGWPQRHPLRKVG